MRLGIGNYFSGINFRGLSVSKRNTCSIHIIDKFIHLGFSPNSRSGNSVLRHHAYAWWPHHLIPVRGIRYFGTMLTHGGLTTLFLFGEFGTSAPCLRMVASPPYSCSGNSVLRHHAYAWWPHHLIPVRGIRYFGTMLTHGGLTTLFLFGEFGTSAPCLRMVASPPYSCSGNSVLHAYAWWPHHLIPVRGIRYFGTMLTHGGLTTLFLFGEFGTSAPCLRMVLTTFCPFTRHPLRMVASPPYSCSGNSVLRHHAYAWWPHHLIPVRGIRYFGTMLTHGGLTTLFLFGEFGTSAPCLRMVASPPYSCSGNSVLRHHAYAWWPHHLIPVRGIRYFGTMLTHGGLTTLFLFGEFGTSAPCLRMVASPPYSCSGNSVLRHHAYAW